MASSVMMVMVVPRMVVVMMRSSVVVVMQSAHGVMVVRFVRVVVVMPLRRRQHCLPANSKTVFIEEKERKKQGTIHLSSEMHRRRRPPCVRRVKMGNICPAFYGVISRWIG